MIPVVQEAGCYRVTVTRGGKHWHPVITAQDLDEAMAKARELYEAIESATAVFLHGANSHNGWHGGRSGQLAIIAQLAQVPLFDRRRKVAMPSDDDGSTWTESAP